MMRLIFCMMVLLLQPLHHNKATAVADSMDQSIINSDSVSASNNNNNSYYDDLFMDPQAILRRTMVATVNKYVVPKTLKPSMHSVECPQSTPYIPVCLAMFTKQTTNKPCGPGKRGYPHSCY